MNQRVEDRLLWAIAALLGLYVAIRAWLLPITVDEASTAINHVPRLVVDTLTFEKEANPNNHILNTLLIKIFTGIFGWHHFVARLPVLLGFCFYAYASMQLVKKIGKTAWLKAFSLLLMFGNPYMLEFFSLARGYGLAAGLMVFALWQAWRFIETNESRPLKLAMLFASLAVYANFTLLIFFAPFSAGILLACWQMNPTFSTFFSKSKAALKTGGIFVLLWITPLKRLSKHSEIINWAELGSFFDSIQRSVRAAIHSNAYFGNSSDLLLTWLVVIGTVCVITIALFRWWKNGWRLSDDPRVFLVLILLGAAIANVVQVYLTKTPYLQARLALFYWPLFALSITVAMSWVQEKFGSRKVWIMVAPLLVIYIINMGRTVNLRSTFEWFHDSDTFTILEFIKQTHLAENRTEPFVFDTEWFMQNSFLYHLEKKYKGYDKYVRQVPYHGRERPKMNSDFFYAISQEEKDVLITEYDVVLRVPNSSLILYRKKR